MLVLNRRVGETIRIGDDIVVMVLGTRGRQAKIGVIAPKDVQIHREEIYDQIHAQAKAIIETPNAGGMSCTVH